MLSFYSTHQARIHAPLCTLFATDSSRNLCLDYQFECQDMENVGENLTSRILKKAASVFGISVEINGCPIKSPITMDREQFASLITAALNPGSPEDKSWLNKGFSVPGSDNNGQRVPLYDVNGQKNNSQSLDENQLRFGQVTPITNVMSQLIASPKQGSSNFRDVTRNNEMSPQREQRGLTSQKPLWNHDDIPSHHEKWYDDMRSRAESSYLVPRYAFDSHVPLQFEDDNAKSISDPHEVIPGEQRKRSFQTAMTKDDFRVCYEEQTSPSSSMDTEYVLKSGRFRTNPTDNVYYVGQVRFGGDSYEYNPKPKTGMSQGMGTRSKANLPGLTKDYMLNKQRKSSVTGSQKEVEPSKDLEACAFTQSKKVRRSPLRGAQPVSTGSLPGTQATTEDHPSNEPVSTGSLPSKATFSRALNNTTSNAEVNGGGNLLDLLEADEKSILMPPPAGPYKRLFPQIVKEPFTIFYDQTMKHTTLFNVTDNESESGPESLMDAGSEFGTESEAGTEFGAEELGKLKDLTKSQRKSRLKKAKQKVKRHQKTAEKMRAAALLAPLSSTTIEIPKQSQPRRSAYFGEETEIAEVDDTLLMNTVVEVQEAEDIGNESRNAFVEQLGLTIQDTAPKVDHQPTSQTRDGKEMPGFGVSQEAPGVGTSQGVPEKDANLEQPYLTKELKARLHSRDLNDPFSIAARCAARKEKEDEEEALRLAKVSAKQIRDEMEKREEKIRAGHEESMRNHIEKLVKLTQIIAEKETTINMLQQCSKVDLETARKLKSLDIMEREFEFMRCELAEARSTIKELRQPSSQNPSQHERADTTESVEHRRVGTSGSQSQGRQSELGARSTLSQALPQDGDTGHENDQRDETHQKGRGQPQDGDTNRTGNSGGVSQREKTTNNIRFVSSSFQQSTFPNNSGNNGDDEDDDERRRRQQQLKSSHQNSTMANTTRQEKNEEGDASMNMADTQIHFQQTLKVRDGNPEDPSDQGSSNSKRARDNYSNYMRGREQSRRVEESEERHSERRRRGRSESDERRRQKLEDRRYQDERDRKKMQMDAMKDALTTFCPGDDVHAFIETFKDWMEVVRGVLPENAIFVKLVSQLKGGAETWAQSARAELKTLTVERILDRLKEAFPPRSDFEKEVYLKEWIYTENKDPSRFWNELVKRINDLGPDVSDREKALRARDALSGDIMLQGMVEYNKHRKLEEVHETFFKYINMKNTARLQNGEKSLFRNRRHTRDLGFSHTAMMEDQEDDEYEVNTAVNTKVLGAEMFLQAQGFPPGILKTMTTSAGNKTNGNRTQPDRNIMDGRMDTREKDSKIVPEEKSNPRYKGKNFNPNYDPNERKAEPPGSSEQRPGRSYGSNNSQYTSNGNGNRNESNFGYPNRDNRSGNGNSRVFSYQGQRGQGSGNNSGGNFRGSRDQDRNNYANRTDSGNRSGNGGRGSRRTMEDCFNCLGNIKYYHNYAHCPLKEVKRLTGIANIQEVMEVWNQTIQSLGGNNFSRPPLGVMDAAFNIIADKYRAGRGQLSMQQQQAYPQYAPTQPQPVPMGNYGQNSNRTQQIAAPPTQQASQRSLNG